MSAARPAHQQTLARLLDQIRRRHSALGAAPPGPAAASDAPTREGSPSVPGDRLCASPARAVGQAQGLAAKPGHLAARLEAFGLLREYAVGVAQEAWQLLQPRAASAQAEQEAVRTVLARHWRQPPAVHSAWHVWLGAPGVGATTCLSKWLVQQVLPTGRQLQVWRLDGVRANTAEGLTILAEAWGVPVRRVWPPRVQPDSGSVQVVDLPGLDWHDPQAVSEVRRALAQLPQPQVHLVLNAAYEVPVWLAQIQALAALPIADLNFSHLDEQPLWGKLWNAVLGTKFALGFLSAGQNVPGPWRPAVVEELLPRQWPPPRVAPPPGRC